tara:strand:- start:163 stop:1326 length:1164 start_codon:yes stop_codon:yes gene_type:complete
MKAQEGQVDQGASLTMIMAESAKQILTANQLAAQGGVNSIEQQNLDIQKQSVINRKEREDKELALEEKKINIDAMVEAAKIEESKKEKNDNLTAKVVMDLLKLVDKQKFQEGGFVEQARAMQPSSVAQASAEEFKQAADLAVKQPIIQPKGFLEQAFEAQRIDPQRAVKERMAAELAEQQRMEAEREMARAPIIPVEREDIVETEEEVEKISEIERQEREKIMKSDDEILNAILEKNLPRLGEGLLEDPQVKVRLNTFDQFHQEMESNFNPKAKNPKSTAAGLYQFTEASLVTAVNRLANTIGEDNLPQWAIEAREHKDARKLSEKEQQILFYADMFQKKGSDNLLKKVLAEGDNDAMIEYYGKLHHTDVDKPTQKRIDKIRKKYEL